jgi:hypothetical protein
MMGLVMQPMQRYSWCTGRPPARSGIWQEKRAVSKERKAKRAQARYLNHVELVVHAVGVLEMCRKGLLIVTHCADAGE